MLKRIFTIVFAMIAFYFVSTNFNELVYGFQQLRGQLQLIYDTKPINFERGGVSFPLLF